MIKEALVVGGGPAGTSAALALRREGFDVTLAEQRTHWTGRVCGAFLASEAVGHLEALGALEAVRAAGAVDVPIAEVAPPSGDPVMVPVKLDGRTPVVLARRALEDALLGQCVAAGVTVAMGTRVLALLRDGAVWNATMRDRNGRQERRRFPLVILADGRFTIGAPAEARPRAGWFGFNATFTGLPRPPGTLTLHVYSGGYVGLAALGDGTTNVCGLAWHELGQLKPWEHAWEESQQRSPSLAKATGSGTRTEDWHGVGPLPFGESIRPSDGPILGGDAAAVGDPFMGEGLGRALATGPMLVSALSQSGGADPAAVLKAYEALWTRRYEARLRAGASARRTLQSKLGFMAASLSLLRSPDKLAALLPAFHGIPA